MPLRKPSLISCLIITLLIAQQQLSIGVGSEDVLSPRQWEQVNTSVDRALEWLAKEQNPDGSFPTLPTGQPGVSSLCVMAFLAQGHLPGEGRYGNNLSRALDYIVASQKRNGILSVSAPNGTAISRNVTHRIGQVAAYNHAIAGLTLSESYAMARPETTKKIEPVIEQALNVSFKLQRWPKDRRVDVGGWRYLNDKDHEDADLSITGWNLMFLRSAKNAGFDVPKEPIDQAIGYVRRCFRKDLGTFVYKIDRGNTATRGMAGAGILALAHAGLHNSQEAQEAGDWILKSGFRRYNRPGNLTGKSAHEDRYHYGLLTCGQAMYQLGGRHWREFFPPTAKALVTAQRKNGSWQAENHHNNKMYGNHYTTAASVLALSAPNQLLPIFQR